MSKLVRTNIVEVIGEDIPTESNVLKTADIFRRECIDDPDMLTMHPLARNQLFIELKQRMSMSDINVIFGMTLIPDSNLLEGEWRVGKEVSKTYEVKS